MSYKEDKKGQMLEEGINEAAPPARGSRPARPTRTTASTWCRSTSTTRCSASSASATSCWAAGDSRTRGFLLGATAGRTTLAGEGLQHQDGHSLLHAATIPNCVAYDPTYAYELAVIIHDGMRRMYVEQESIFYYIAVMNENYVQPAMPQGVEQGILKGAYLLQMGGAARCAPRSRAPAPSFAKCIAAAALLEKDYGVPTDVFSVTSFNELRREALEVERWNLLHPGETPRVPYVQQLFKDRDGPVIAATDYMRTVPDQIRQWVGSRYVTLGTDGYGRSDSRAQLRKHFEVDRNHIAIAALRALADEGKVDKATRHEGDEESCNRPEQARSLENLNRLVLQSAGAFWVPALAKAD